MMNQVAQKDFHHQFNDLFEKNMMKKVDESCNDWFKNEDALYSATATKGNIKLLIQHKRSDIIYIRNILIYFQTLF